MIDCSMDRIDGVLGFNHGFERVFVLLQWLF